MKDEELKLEEIEASHTQGEAGEVAKGQGNREGVDATLLFDKRNNINFADGGIICQVGLLCQFGCCDNTASACTRRSSSALLHMSGTDNATDAAARRVRLSTRCNHHGVRVRPFRWSHRDACGITTIRNRMRNSVCQIRRR